MDAETSIKEHHAASSNNDIERLTDIYIGLGDIFADINSLKTASYYYDNALMLFEDADDNESVITLLITMGKLYDDNHIPDIALLYYEMAEEKNDIPQYLADKIDFCKITALYELGDIKTADSIFMSIDPADKNDMDFHKVSYLYFITRVTMMKPYNIFCIVSKMETTMTNSQPRNFSLPYILNLTTKTTNFYIHNIRLKRHRLK